MTRFSGCKVATNRAMEACRQGMALGLCVILAGPIAANAAQGKRVEAAHKSTAQSMPANQRAVHLLNRLAFGPTVADLAEVKRLGVDGWFEQQLYPERIADTAVETRLDEFPALKMSVSDLLRRFPDGAAIRQAANGTREIPGDPVLREIYERQIALFEARQERKSDDPDHAQQANAKAVETGGMASAAGVAGKFAGSANEDEMQPLDVATVTAVLKLAPEARLKRVMAMAPREFAALEATLKGPQRQQLTAHMTAEERETLEDFRNPKQTIVEEEQAERLLREIYSSRQLEEVMTSFWLNHFNIYLHKNQQEPYYLVSYERDVIRPRALGNFEDLLVATAESPAMLLYL
ncbi:MAG TPA: DUF1800 family protein, partial [Acidobacteriaceae bacterium]|nr:DUF1800 family protein [Acidobacteriaceae bacterium]